VPRCPELKTGIPSPIHFSRLLSEFGRPDVIHLTTQGPFGMTGRLLARSSGICCCGFRHTDWPGYTATYLSALIGGSRGFRRAYSELGRQFEAWFFAECKVVFCHTEASAARLQSGPTCAKIVLISEFLDTSRFPICAVTKPPLAGRALSLAYVGRLALEKSLDSLLKYSMDSGIVIHVVGDGPLRSQLERRYPAAYYHGYLYGNTLRRALASADYLALPSCTETLGLVVLEAAACGVPSILIQGVCPSELVRRYAAGIFVPRFEEPHWVDVARAVRDSPSYEGLLRGCREMATDQSVEVGTERILSTWLSVI